MSQICVRNCEPFMTEWLPVLKKARLEWFLYASIGLGALSAASFFMAVEETEIGKGTLMEFRTKSVL